MAQRGISRRPLLATIGLTLCDVLQRHPRRLQSGCGETFKQVLRRLLQADEIICPKCGMAIDIRESKRTGEIGKDFDTATQLDIKAGSTCLGAMVCDGR